MFAPSEAVAIKFLEQYSKDPGYWSDFDERLRTAKELLYGSRLQTYIRPYADTRNFLVTDLVRRRATRLSKPIPPVGGDLRVYDNGAAQIYRTRARTPYQE
jgi:hypothetical protein